MADPSFQTTQLQACLERMRAGDPTARDELLRHGYERLQRLTRKMLKGYPGVKRWAQTDDVLQNALLRLLRALEDVSPATIRDFFALMTEEIRRELIDMARHYYGPLGLGTKHATNAGDSQTHSPRYEPADASDEPGALAAWCEFHEQVRNLSDEEREVVGLLFYQGLTQAEAAAVLHVTVRTVQRRWQAALLKLHQVLRGQWPGREP
jgi:RNA polymerase sigma factor (sigma-70 family)